MAVATEQTVVAGALAALAALALATLALAAALALAATMAVVITVARRLRARIHGHRLLVLHLLGLRLLLWHIDADDAVHALQGGLVHVGIRGQPNRLIDGVDGLERIGGAAHGNAPVVKLVDPQISRPDSRRGEVDDELVRLRGDAHVFYGAVLEVVVLEVVVIVTGDLTPRWICWFISMVFFLYIVYELLVGLSAA